MSSHGASPSDGPLDDRLGRKLLKRRGRLHAFTDLAPRQTAVVVVDAVTSFVRGVPNADDVTAAINRLTAAVRRAGGLVAWVTPTAPSTWPTARLARALLGKDEVDRYDVEMRDGGPGVQIDAALTVHDRDWRAVKAGYSAFFPGNCALPDQFRKQGVDTVIVAGLLTNICVEASARDAHEMGFRVLVCADGVAANEAEAQRNSLRTLARVYADVRRADDIVDLIRRSRCP